MLDVFREAEYLFCAFKILEILHLKLFYFNFNFEKVSISSHFPCLGCNCILKFEIACERGNKLFNFCP